MCYIHIYCQVAMWKNKKKYSHLKKFREIILQYDLSVKFVKEMISRKFSSKLMREKKSHNFKCGNARNYQLFSNFFSKTDDFTKFLPIKSQCGKVVKNTITILRKMEHFLFVKSTQNWFLK